MIPYYYVIGSDGCSVPVKVRQANRTDYNKTEVDQWQTSWLSSFIQQNDLEKYALVVSATNELIALGAYRDMPEGVLVYVEYIESAPHSNPTMDVKRKYRGIGAVMLAFGIQLSIDYGYGGAIYLKAKTTEIREHYIHDFGAVPFSHTDPFLLLIDGDASKELFSHYLKEE